MTWYTWQNPVSGGQFQMHSHLVSPGHVFCVHHGPVAYQKLFSKGLKFSATAGISLLKIFNSLHLILPLGPAINIPLLLFPQLSPPPPMDLQDHESKPYLKLSPGYCPEHYWAWNVLSAEPKEAYQRLSSFEKGDARCSDLFFPSWWIMSACPWPLELWIFREFISHLLDCIQLTKTFRDNHFLFCLIRVMSHNIILGQNYKCMFLSFLCELLLIL